MVKTGNHYVYKITFEEVPHFYIGSRRCPNNETPATDPYLGSPKTHRGYWNAYTPKKSIFSCDLSEEEARDLEGAMIRENWKSEYCLNENAAGAISLEASSRGREAFQERRRNDPEFASRLKDSCAKAGAKGAKAIYERRRNDPKYDREYRAKISNGKSGGMWITNGVEDKVIKYWEPIPEGFRAGSTKIKEATSGTKHHSYGLVWITNGSVNKKIPKGDAIPEGFYPGMRPRQQQTK